MKFLIVKQGQTADALAARLAAHGGLARLQALNPHLDLQRLTPGSMLIWPPDAGGDEGRPVAAGTFDDFASDVRAGLNAATTRARAGLAQQEDQRKEAAAVFRSAAFKRVLETDAELKAQATAADGRAKALQARGKEIEGALAALGRTAESGLEALRDLFDPR
jgi:hypothetical protein